MFPERLWLEHEDTGLGVFPKWFPGPCDLRNSFGTTASLQATTGLRDPYVNVTNRENSRAKVNKDFTECATPMLG